MIPSSTYAFPPTPTVSKFLYQAAKELREVDSLGFVGNLNLKQLEARQ